jgi:hypothetical protein
LALCFQSEEAQAVTGKEQRQIIETLRAAVERLLSARAPTVVEKKLTVFEEPAATRQEPNVEEWSLLVDLFNAIEALAAMGDVLQLEEKFACAELLRDPADALDRGRVFRPRAQRQSGRRLVKSTRIDHDGATLYRIM